MFFCGCPFLSGVKRKPNEKPPLRGVPHIKIHPLHPERGIHSNPSAQSCVEASILQDDSKLSQYHYQGRTASGRGCPPAPQAKSRLDNWNGSFPKTHRNQKCARPYFWLGNLQVLIPHLKVLVSLPGVRRVPGICWGCQRRFV